jgi:hypothetical protein
VQGYQRGHSHRINDWDEFRTFAQHYGDKTPTEMAQLWQGDISERTMSRALARIRSLAKVNFAPLAPPFWGEHEFKVPQNWGI